MAMGAHWLWVGQTMQQERAILPRRNFTMIGSSGLAAAGTIIKAGAF
jgi:hypothetical protein